MDVIGIGPLELMFIILIVILVVGPRDIGKTARSVGKFLNRLYKSEEWQNLTKASRALRTLPQRLAREAELEELASIRNSLKDTARELQTARKEIASDSNAALRSYGKDKSARKQAMDSWKKPLPSKEESGDDPPAPPGDNP